MHADVARLFRARSFVLKAIIREWSVCFNFPLIHGALALNGAMIRVKRVTDEEHTVDSHLCIHNSNST